MNPSASTVAVPDFKTGDRVKIEKSLPDGQPWVRMGFVFRFPEPGIVDVNLDGGVCQAFRLDELKKIPA